MTGHGRKAARAIACGLALLALDLREREARHARLCGKRVPVGRDMLRVDISFSREGESAVALASRHGRGVFRARLWLEGGRLRGEHRMAREAPLPRRDADSLALMLRWMLSEKGLKRLEEGRIDDWI